MRSNIKKREDILTEIDNVIDFNAAKTKFASGGPGDENWLKNLSQGTVFLARPKSKPGQEKSLILNKYMVLEHKTSVSNLMVGTPDKQQMEIWTPTLEFSRQFELIEEIAHVQFEYDHNETSETTDGSNSPRPVQSNGVEEPA